MGRFSVICVTVVCATVTTPAWSQVEEAFCEGERCTPSRLELVIGDDVNGGSGFSGSLRVGDDIRTTVVLDTRAGPVAGWSYGVVHAPSIFDIQESSCEADGDAFVCGTDADAARIDPSFNVSTVVDGPDGERSGFVSAVVLSFVQPSNLPDDQRNSLARVSYRVVQVPQEPTLIRFVDGVLSSGGPPVGIVITIGIESFRPAILVHAEIEHVGSTEDSVDLCTDGIDNDGDGLLDCDDADCQAIPEVQVACLPPEPRFIRGDTDDSSRINVTDAVVLFLALFAGLVPDFDCLDARDVDDDGSRSLTDGIVLLDWLFRQGPVLPPPSPNCGTDLTEDDLDCAVASANCGE